MGTVLQEVGLQRAGPALARLWVLLAITLGLSACATPYDLAQQPQVSCSARRLDAAKQLFEASRQNLARHFRERSANTLMSAYYFAGDAASVARSTRGCFDYDNTVRYQAGNLIKVSQQLRNLAFASMRDQNTQAAMTLLGDQYQDIFARRDIE